MTGFLKNNFPILIIILMLFLYLGIKAFDKNGWDGWGFGSAQTLMTVDYWVKDGFAKNYFLFIAVPYSKLAHYLDEPEFRNRPIDTAGGALARDRRLYYSHYPPLYIVPYALLGKIGIESRALFRIFSLLISLAGLFFFYWFIKSIAGKTAATVASIYYGFSVTFLNYADSISVQPWDILFIFLILSLSVLAWREFVSLRDISLLIWLAYFALSLLSYDATFFIFAYLVFFDILILKKFFWKRWLFFASAPVLGFALQIIQNVWYLGWHDMISDFSGVYAERTFRGAKNFIIGLTAPFVSMTSFQTIFIFKKTAVALTSAIAIFVSLWEISRPLRQSYSEASRERNFRQKINLHSDYFKIVFILAVAAVVQPFFVNTTGGWPFAGVLTAPFWGLLIGIASIFIKNIFQHKEFGIYKTASFGILTAAVLILWTVQFYSTYNYIKDWPNNKPDQKVIEFSKEIKTLYPNEEKITFRILPQNPVWKSQFGTFNMEYYFGMLKIDFANTKDLLADFLWLRNRSEYPFYSFIVSENRSDILKIRQELSDKNIRSFSPMIEMQGQYLFTVGFK